MEFNLLSLGKNYGDWWVDVIIVKFGIWEPALLRLHSSNGKLDFDMFGIGELLYYLKRKKR